MTPEAFAAKMREIDSRCYTEPHYDEERSHSDADKAMVELLRELGYSEAMDVFVAMPKWYS